MFLAEAGFARRSLNCAGRASTQRGAHGGNRVSPVKRALRRRATLGARVRAVVDAAQAPGIDVRVDLGRRQRAVPEELLDRAEVGSAFQ
jgi:hypothetical protein